MDGALAMRPCTSSRLMGPQSMEQLRAILFKGIPTVRINDTFERPEMATDLMESDLTKLNLLYQQGGESFAKHEDELKVLLSKKTMRA